LNKIHAFVVLLFTSSGVELFRCQFHQCSTGGFYALRSQKRKRRQSSCQSFLCFWDLQEQKLLIERDKIDPRRQFHQQFMNRLYTKVLCTYFRYLQLVFEYFWWKKMCKKAVRKLLVKLTTDCFLNSILWRHLRLTLQNSSTHWMNSRITF